MFNRLEKVLSDLTLDPVKLPSFHHSSTVLPFDYLLRFHIKYLNPEAITSRWVAESSLKYIELRLEKIKERKSPDDKIILPMIKYWYKEGKKIISKAKKSYSIFLKSGKITDNLIKSTLLLSKLDFILRAGYTIVSINQNQLHY